MILATLNDTHFGVKNDVQYMLDYQERFYKYVYFPTLLKNGVKNILHGGDIFDRRKYINYTTLNRTKKMFLDPAREYGMTIDIIPGNHDVALKNSNEINSLRELLYGYDNINIIENPEVKEYDGCKVMFLPWMNGQNHAEFMKFVADNDADILYGHLELSGFEMYAGVKNDHGMDAASFAKFGQVWSGHFHHQSKKGNIHYLGAPMEFTFADCDDARGFHLFDTETKKLEFQENPNKLFEKIYYSDETTELQQSWRDHDVDQYADKVIKLFVTKKTNPVLFESFIDRLYKVNLIDLTIMEDYSEFHESNVDLEIKYNSTKDLMDKYVETAYTDMDKPRLKTILNNLYIEALHTETR